MTKTEYREYLQTPAWQQRRKEVLKVIPVCMKCWIPRWVAQIAYDQDLHVHHKSYAHVGNELPYELAPLCRRCHEMETFGRTDLRELKSHKCEFCEARVFDPYAECCEACSGILNEQYTRKLLVAERPNYGGATWEMLVYIVAGTVGIDAVLKLISDRQWEIDRDFEWQQERLKQA